MFQAGVFVCNYALVCYDKKFSTSPTHDSYSALNESVELKQNDVLLAFRAYYRLVLFAQRLAPFNGEEYVFFPVPHSPWLSKGTTAHLFSNTK